MMHCIGRWADFRDRPELVIGLAKAPKQPSLRTELLAPKWLKRPNNHERIAPFRINAVRKLHRVRDRPGSFSAEDLIAQKPK